MFRRIAKALERRRQQKAFRRIYVRNLLFAELPPGGETELAEAIKELKLSDSQLRHDAHFAAAFQDLNFDLTILKMDAALASAVEPRRKQNAQQIAELEDRIRRTCEKAPRLFCRESLRLLQPGPPPLLVPLPSPPP